MQLPIPYPGYLGQNHKGVLYIREPFQVNFPSRIRGRTSPGSLNARVPMDVDFDEGEDGQEIEASTQE